MKLAFVIIRVSHEDQLKGYGPDVQWLGDVVPKAPLLGLRVSDDFKAIIQESATGWDREKFEEAVRHAVELYRGGKVAALLFPRVDRETRFLFGSVPRLAEVLRSGMEVYFAREKLRLDPEDPESVECYFNKAIQAQAYVETMKENTAEGRRQRALRDHKMPTGGHKWAFDYDPATGRYRRNEERARWILKCDEWILDGGLSLRKCCRRLEAAAVASAGWEEWSRALGKGRIWPERRPPRRDKWHPGTLRNILLDEANLGRFYAFRHEMVKVPGRRKRQVPTDPSRWVLVYEDPSQAIRTPDRHEALKRKLELNRQNSFRHARRSYPPLRSLVFCPLCQRRMIGWTYCRSVVAYYVCYACGNRVRAYPLWEELRQAIKEKLLEPERLLSGLRSQLDSGRALERLEQERLNLEREVGKWQRARDRSRRLFVLSQDEDAYAEEKYRKEVAEIRRQEERASRELAQVLGQIAELHRVAENEDGIRRFCEQVRQNLDELDDSRWRVLLERMNVRVVVPPAERVRVLISLPPAEGESGAIASSLSRTPASW